MRRGYKWLALTLVLVLVATGSILYWKTPAAKGADESTESTVQVQKGAIRFTVSGTSQLAAKNVQTISAPADGTVQTMNLEKGKEVKKGAVLFVLSDPSLSLSLKESEESLTQMEKELTKLKAQAGHLQVTASAAGLLTLAGNVDLGSNLNASSKIGTLADNSVFTATVPFAAEEAADLRKGDSVEVAVENFALTKPGTITKIDSTLYADAAGNRIVQVTIRVPNDGSLSAGLNVTASVERGGTVRASTGKGTLDYLSVVPVMSEAGGTISELNVKSGGVVKAGDVIAVLANDSLPDDIAAKESSVERQKLLVENNRKKVATLTVTAPFDGVFSTDFADSKANVLANYPVGAQIAANTQLGAVSSPAVMQLAIQVDELDLPDIKLEQKVSVTVDALPTLSLEGTVSQISSVGTTTNGVTSYDVVLDVTNPGDGQLKSGMTATAEILIQEKKDILVLPSNALQSFRGKRYVTLKNADGSLEEQHEVTVGIRSETSVEITDGLSEGDTVVVPTAEKSTQLTEQQISQMRQMFQNGAGQGGNTGGFGGGGMNGGGFTGGAGTGSGTNGGGFSGGGGSGGGSGTRGGN
ncbi:efflux RND transporter periplasmic adaptor subunit [Gorillibacterium timonense]|uniref:efflux RND transporter periplasmic adaptor subunit n=1 Tax=Gorillibacterium timonense TaxID=1689269 RepID=UPI00071D6F8D|nr:efflux RND transporter periplasmic adaptor subunit [Gorillibacterium timonense]